MRHAYLLLLFVPFFSAAQQAQIGTYFTADIPVRSVMPKMSTNAGIGLQFAYKPLPRFPMMVELKGSLGSYSYRTMQQTYIFDDESQTTTDVTFSSAMNKWQFGTKFHIGHAYRPVRGFITPQIGGAVMRSKIAIAIPGEEDDCVPMDRNTFQKDRGFFYGGEVGVEVDMNRLFRNVATEDRHRLYFSVNFMKSFGKFEYVNVKYMKDHDHEAMHGGGTGEPTSEDGRDINTTFVNVTNGDIHEHKIAELYRTDLRLWGFSVGYVFSF